MNKETLTYNIPVKAVLFDLDGVIIDTEPQYDVFWRTISEKYNLGIKNFEKIIKGTTLPNIISRYLSSFPTSVQREIEVASRTFDKQLNMIPVSGALEFLADIKKTDTKTGLVTSSDNAKLAAVFSALPIRDFFDTVVSADRITQGKPHPMCYILAAMDLGVMPEQCVVFEDSVAGIISAHNAAMRVVGLATTLPEDKIREYTNEIINDFSETVSLKKLLGL